jgi:hypothetical protein
MHALRDWAQKLPVLMRDRCFPNHQAGQSNCVRRSFKHLGSFSFFFLLLREKSIYIIS